MVLLLSFWFANCTDLLEPTNLEIKFHSGTLLSLRLLSEPAEVNAEYITGQAQSANLRCATNAKFATCPMLGRSHPGRLVID
jgi:glycine cleavage system pyridoxal-binding protein P